MKLSYKIRIRYVLFSYFLFQSNVKESMTSNEMSREWKLRSVSVRYRVSIKSFPDYKHLLQENYVEYKRIFFNIT